MIEEVEIDGRPALAIYLLDDMTPTDPANAKLVKIVFRDSAETRWGVPMTAPEDELPEA
jgi:hypothetical protein